VTLIRSAARARSNRALTIIAGAIAIVLLLPLVSLLLDAQQSGWAEFSSVLFRARSLTLLVNTVVLVITVAPLAAILGTAAAWFTEKTQLPLRRVWTVVLVLPIAMPDFVVAYAWHSIAPTAQPFAASILVMTLSTYPLVYLPVAASLRRMNPATEESARSLGLGSFAIFWRVVLPVIRAAILSGSLLVVLILISEYGAFEILRFQTFTTEVFTEFQFNPAGAGALSFPLVVLGLLVLGAETFVSGAAATATTSIRRASRLPLGRKVIGVTSGLGALVLLAVAVPIGTLIYWMSSSQQTTLPAQATLLQATGATVGYCAAGAALAVVLALPISYLSARQSNGLARLIERSTYVTLALPGVVIALSLAFFAVNFVYGIYETSTLLIIAYALLSFPLALSCMRTSMLQVPVVLPDVGRSLGRSASFVFVRVTLPLVLPGIIAGFCLVFLTSTTELTATLVLAPLGVETLTTQFWAFQSETAYGAAAPYGLVVIAIAMIPGALLALWFDRLGQRS
jgi:iron(III) transport system permease protein